MVAMEVMAMVIHITTMDTIMLHLDTMEMADTMETTAIITETMSIIIMTMVFLIITITTTTPEEKCT